VFGYLQHHGYWDSAAAVARDVLGGAVAVSPQDVQDMQVGCCGQWLVAAPLFAVLFAPAALSPLVGVALGCAGHAGGLLCGSCGWLVAQPWVLLLALLLFWCCGGLLRSACSCCTYQHLTLPSTASFLPCV
jgi:hypothetical protein